MMIITRLREWCLQINASKCMCFLYLHSDI